MPVSKQATERFVSKVRVSLTKNATNLNFSTYESYSDPEQAILDAIWNLSKGSPSNDVRMNRVISEAAAEHGTNRVDLFNAVNSLERKRLLTIDKPKFNRGKLIDAVTGRPL